MTIDEGMTITFTIDFVVEEDGDGFHAYCPALEGLHVDGESVEEALEYAKEAAVAYLRSLMKHGDPIPVGIEAKVGNRQLPTILFRHGATCRKYVERLAVPACAGD